MLLGGGVFIAGIFYRFMVENSNQFSDRPVGNTGFYVLLYHVKSEKMRQVAIYISILIISLHTHGQTMDNPDIVVTSTWTAAYLKMAGVEDFEMLAPSDMQHPSEYELQIDDILKLKNADLIICGGYEIMMDKIRKGLEIDPERIIEIKTDYREAHILESVRRIARMTGTSELAEKNLASLQNVIKESRQKIDLAGVSKVPVLVQHFLVPLSEELGLNVVGKFGPRQLEAFDIREMMELDFDLILDNAHNPSAKPLAESKTNVTIAYWINFPGQGNTETIEDVIKYNVDEIISSYNTDR
jgi:ABC-type Fe3+-hydroxamate transport system substrate-binding protein